MTPLEEYNQTVELSLEIKKKAVRRAENCFKMQLKSAKSILQQCQKICDHEYEDTSATHRGEIIYQEFTCNKCGHTSGVLPSE